MGVAALVLVLWWLGREPRGDRAQAPPAAQRRVGSRPGAGAAAGTAAGGAAASGSLAAYVADRVTDADDPDGAFMDGYVSGRYTERLEQSKARAVERDRRDVDPDRTRPGSDDLSEDHDHDDDWEADVSAYGHPTHPSHGRGGHDDPTHGWHPADFSDESDDW